MVCIVLSGWLNFAHNCSNSFALDAKNQFLSHKCDECCTQQNRPDFINSNYIHSSDLE